MLQLVQDWVIVNNVQPIDEDFPGKSSFEISSSREPTVEFWEWLRSRRWFYTSVDSDDGTVVIVPIGQLTTALRELEESFEFTPVTFNVDRTGPFEAELENMLDYREILSDLRAGKGTLIT